MKHAGGSYKSIDKQVVFVPKKERNRDKVNVPVYIASSSIKSLFLIDMYVNYLAEPNGLLIIDEPELNLHPDNQRKMAGLLASLVNSGIKILITTHSDYLIRELNNRIMLSSNFKNKNAILKEEYIDSHEILRPEQVKAYSLTGDHKINSIEVGLYGMNMEIFDCLIEKANRLSENIFYGMENLRD
ncbi:AAA family ATPase [Neisseria subflava]|uniref:AAA family ATPase n=1 Tax=Neisseria subflava TaxID=28449 RepID=UPI0022083068|nr:AAA family ATPase [Neisseria subflava]